MLGLQERIQPCGVHLSPLQCHRLRLLHFRCRWRVPGLQGRLQHLPRKLPPPLPNTTSPAGIDQTFNNPRTEKHCLRHHHHHDHNHHHCCLWRRFRIGIRLGIRIGIRQFRRFWRKRLWWKLRWFWWWRFRFRRKQCGLTPSQLPRLRPRQPLRLLRLCRRILPVGWSLRASVHFLRQLQPPNRCLPHLQFRLPTAKRPVQRPQLPHTNCRRMHLLQKWLHVEPPILLPAR